MLLAINIGNSSIRLAIFDQASCLNSWIIDSKTSRTVDELYSLFKNYYHNYGISEGAISEIVIASVVPKHTNNISQALSRLHGVQPKVVDRTTPSKVKHQSNQLGTDLYANAVYAFEKYRKQALIIDLGTALSMIAINNQGIVLGVTIAPGMNTALQALVGNTSQLTDIELKAPPKVLGKDTISCMQSGMVYGYLSLIEGMIQRIKKEIGEDTYVILTGGLCHIFEELSKEIDVIDKLHTIKGVRQLFIETQNNI